MLLEALDLQMKNTVMKNFPVNTVWGILLLSAILFSAGCCSSGFYAVSSAKDGKGGICQIKSYSCEQIVQFPVLNAMLVHPRSGSIFGTANRISGSKSRSGAVAVFSEENGKLKNTQTVPANGRTPCHLCLSPCGKFLYTANYSSGDISQFRISDGVLVSPPGVIKHTGRSVTARQRSPHPHYVGFDPAGKQLFVCDLGTDEVVIYNFCGKKGIQLPPVQKVRLPAGAGPRHLVFDPAGKVFYTANELNSTASSFIRNADGSWQLHMTCSTLSANRSVRNYPGAIKITSDGRYFFVTNRGDDSIAVFSADGKGNFKLLHTAASGGKFPSDLLVLNGGRRIAVSNLRSGNISCFSFDPCCGKLALPDRSISVGSPIFLCR